MKVLVKKFSLKRDGIEYNTGAVVDIPVDDARYLISTAPTEFETVTPTYEDMTVDELKALAKTSGVDITGLRRKADIIEVLKNA